MVYHKYSTQKPVHHSLQSHGVKEPSWSIYDTPLENLVYLYSIPIQHLNGTKNKIKYSLWLQFQKEFVIHVKMINDPGVGKKKSVHKLCDQHRTKGNYHCYRWSLCIRKWAVNSKQKETVRSTTNRRKLCDQQQTEGNCAINNKRVLSKLCMEQKEHIIVTGSVVVLEIQNRPHNFFYRYHV